MRDKIILLIALATFLLSAGYAFLYRIPPSVDASAYDQVGWNIAQGHGFRLALGVPIEQDEVITYQGPAYQFFLAGMYTVFGHHREVVWIAQAVMRALCVLMLYAICRKIFREQGQAIGWIAGGVFGFYPDLVEIGAMLMTETFFIFLTVLVLWLSFREYDKPTPLGASLLGAGFGVAILGRSIILLFAPVFLWWFWRRMPTLKLRHAGMPTLKLRHAGMPTPKLRRAGTPSLKLRRTGKAWIPFLGFAAAATLVLTPWTVRNWNAYHKFIPTMANSGYNLWVGNRHGATGEGGNPAYMQDIMKVYGMTGTGEYFTGEFKTFVREYPFEYAQLTGGRFIKYFSFIRPMGFWFYQSGLPQLLFILSSIGAGFVLFSLSFSGILLTWLRERNEALRDLSLFAFFTAFAIIPIIITTRYRLPIYPILAIFAAFAVMRAYRNFKETVPFILGGTAIVLGIAVIDLVQFSEKIFGRIQTMLS